MEEYREHSGQVTITIDIDLDKEGVLENSISEFTFPEGYLENYIIDMKRKYAITKYSHRITNLEKILNKINGTVSL
jgi:hypothetical protein